jgi:hypothetical protein
LSTTTTEPIYLEIGSKRVFACSVTWPGWCRVAKSEEDAMETLARYADRYAVVAGEAGIDFPPAQDGAFDASELEVVERAAGSATTDFGAPGAVPDIDARPIGADEAARAGALVAATWRVFDAAAARAPAVLPKGPRGGGRDRDKIVEHVIEAERSYARLLGIRYTPTQFREPGALEAMRAEILVVLEAAADGAPLVEKGWPPRCAARRIAWHVLDHAWELEDKTG